MTFAVWKYHLRVADEETIEMPKGAQILCVAEQFGIPTLWARVDTTADKVPRGIVIIGTGHQAPAPDDPFAYIGSFQSLGGDFVGHVFDAGERPS